jgi:hypothetical protein
VRLRRPIAITRSPSRARWSATARPRARLRSSLAGTSRLFRVIGVSVIWATYWCSSGRSRPWRAASSRACGVGTHLQQRDGT